MITAGEERVGASHAARFGAVIAALAFATAMAQGEASEALLNEVTFQSASYVNFGQLLSREAPAATVTVQATFSFPDEATDRYPAVLVVHTIVGFSYGREVAHLTALRRMPGQGAGLLHGLRCGRACEVGGRIDLDF